MGFWVSQNAEILANAPLEEAVYHLKLKASLIAHKALPGQFVALGGFGTLLPRPFDLYRINPKDASIEIIYRVKGTGTHLLSQRPPGTHLTVNGPFGQNIMDRLHTTHRLALIGRGVGLAPFPLLAEAAARRGIEVHTYASVRHASLFEPFRDLSRWGSLTLWSDEDHPGAQITDAFAQDLKVLPFEAALVVGSRRLARSTLSLSHDYGFIPYMLSESSMGCGFGYCKACALPLRNGYSLA